MTSIDDRELYAFSDAERLAADLAQQLGLAARGISVHRFPDGESLIRVMRGDGPRALVLRSLDHPNEKLLEVLMAADALRRQGVSEIGLVAPYLGYMRQDRVFNPGEAISQRVMANLLSNAFDSVITVEAHLHRIARLDEVFTCPATSISAAEAIADWLSTQASADLLVGPDAESEPWVRAIAARAEGEVCIARKTRHSDRHVEVELPAFSADAKSAWIIDDIASSGGTLETVARALARRGIEQINAVVVHALFEPGALDRLHAAGIERIVTSDSLPHPTNRISLAATLSRALAPACARPDRPEERS